MERMERDILVDEIYNFCFDYGVLVDKKAIKKNIEKGLGKAEIVESIYNMVFTKAKRGKVEDVERAKELLIELEKIRLDLEFRDYHLVQKSISPVSKK